jgi:tripartite-type tricarboxylate transporter receptor subunit TctC
VAGAAAAVALAAGVMACGSSGSHDDASTTAVDTAFFAGKTITYIVPQSPGGSYAAAILPAVPYVEKYLKATLDLEYVPQGTSIVGQDRIAAAPADGLTIGTLSVSADVALDLEGQQLIDFDITKQSLIAGNYLSPEVVVACKGSPYKTIEQVLDAKKPFKVINTGQGPGFELVKVLFNAYGAPVSSLSGYADTASQTAGCLRGDAPLALQTIAALTPQDFQQGLVRGLVVTSPQPPSSTFYKYLKNTPTLASLEQSKPPKSANGKKVLSLIKEQYGTTGLGVIVAGPKGIPAGQLAALREAFKKAYEQPAVSRAMTQAGIVPGYVSPSAAVPYMNQLLKNRAFIEAFVNKNS